MGTPATEPPVAEQLAYVAHQADQLRQAGVRVLMRQDPEAPDVIGTLVQLLPDGPMVVHVDTTKSPLLQSYMLMQAFEFIFNEPEADWNITDALGMDGKPLRFRTLRFRVED